MDKEKLIRVMREELRDDPSTTTIKELITALAKACKLSIPKTGGNRGWPPVYWWTQEVAQQRKICIAARRKATRERKRGEEQGKNSYENYKQERKKLCILIRKEKAKGWEKLCEEVENDPWGKGYQIVKEKLGRRNLRASPDMVLATISHLFPKDGNIGWRKRPVTTAEHLVTKAELEEACKRMKNKKAPGLDGLSADVIKEVAGNFAEHMVAALNQLLAEGQFPQAWKTAKLVLLKKPGRSGNEPSSYRPICLIDVMGKIWERILANRLQKELEAKEDLSDNQYGFRRGRSTMQPLLEVVDTAKRIKTMSYRHRQICGLLLLDVKNAFNMAKWGLIIKSLRDRRISEGLINVIMSYLEDRRIIDEYGREHTVTRGVPQGSVLRPLLWNILYDGVLNLPVEDGVKLIAFADDLAIVCSAIGKAELEEKANRTIHRWMHYNGLQLATEKTELIILSGHKKMDLKVRVGNAVVRPTKCVKYLGVLLDRNLCFTNHVDHVVGRAMATVNQVGRLMPHVRGAGEKKRRLLMTVGQSIVLYASEVWHTGTDLAVVRKKLKCVDRAMAIRVCRAYRTVSWECSIVLARCIPLIYLVKERIASKGKSKSEKKEIREKTLCSWQREWTAGVSWTRKLIRDLPKWYGREHGSVSFHLAQVLSGHGCFQTYLQRIGKVEEDKCRYCSEKDNAEHTLFYCTKFAEARATTNEKLGVTLSQDNLVNLMLRGETEWEIIVSMVSRIMVQKEEEQRRRTNNPSRR